ncbi:hypothetical protein [Acidithiobacillus concretivorus]|uniref:Lipoprotein n=1 Tax=Acidithiobacillus concretivorus TaxID=3063952 RepID=A0ABS5ZTL1_9PROT|nr:hypothetical protein [Acidithiobacillus concretivorus]MBU2739740.1 hypothetical protein [Acidithiobacillus concretivorus]
MRHTKTLRLAGFIAAVAFLSGCATTVPMPKVSYNGPAVQNSPLADKTVALVTTTTGDKFNDPECSDLTIVRKACRHTTLDSKTSIQDYNKLMAEALTEEGAKVVADPPADIVIHTHMIPMVKHHYMFLLNYDEGHTMAMQLIPFYGNFSPRYFHVIGHMDDVVTVTNPKGDKVLSKSYPISVRKQITGSDHASFTYNGSASKADNVYLSSQSAVIAKILVDTNQKLQAQGSTTPP